MRLYSKSNPSACVTTDDNNKVISFDTWHKFNGEWVHICQVFTEEETKFYTNGNLEE
jgi:hypothetical protein